MGVGKPLGQPLQLSGFKEKRALTQVTAIGVEKLAKGVWLILRSPVGAVCGWCADPKGNDLDLGMR